MSEQSSTLSVTLPRGGYKPGAAVAAVQQARLTEAMVELAPGPFGCSASGQAVLEALAAALDLGAFAAIRLEGMLRSELGALARAR